MHNFKDLLLGLSYDDVLLVPQISNVESRSDVDLSTQITPRVKLNIPLISINMTDVTGVEMAVALGKLGGIGFLPRFETPEKQAEMVKDVKKQNVYVGAAVGCREGYLKRAEMLANAGADILTLDVAHGGMIQAIEATGELKRMFGRKCDIVSGVIGTYETAYALYKAGADSVRVGVGPGTICITRIQTGVGVPQITAVAEAYRAAKHFNDILPAQKSGVSLQGRMTYQRSIHLRSKPRSVFECCYKTVICDGGTKNSGDIVKGLAAGASAVIVGSQFAGHDEAPGKIVIKDGIKYKTYNASTSLAEKENHSKKLNGLSSTYIKHIEGIESFVLYKGPVRNSIEKWEANIRSGYSYCGAKNIKELWQNAKFIRVSSLGVRENGVHDVIVQ